MRPASWAPRRETYREGGREGGREGWDVPAKASLGVEKATKMRPAS